MRDISSGRGDKGKEGYKFLLRGETLRCGEYEFPFKELLLIDSDRQWSLGDRFAKSPSQYCLYVYVKELKEI